MGQQQLLLLVLGTVIVGLGVVAGIDAFNTNQKSANQDALVNDAVSIASDAQAWMEKPEPYGGAGASGDWTNFEMSDVGRSSPETTQNGEISVVKTDADSLVLQATNSSYSNTVRVGVGGTTSSDIVTEIK